MNERLDNLERGLLSALKIQVLFYPSPTGIRHIDLQKCICYNASRQKEVKGSMQGKSPQSGNSGGFLLCFYGTLIISFDNNDYWEIM